MTDAERQRLAAILGMLGSEHQGERDNAARQAEAFRKKHGLSWAELLASGGTVYIEVPVYETPAAPPPQPRHFNIFPVALAIYAVVFLLPLVIFLPTLLGH
jgi:hypothetical protein